MQNRKYIAIDLKSFYASVECVERGLNPLTTNLVVADVSRTSKTICLAVSPSLKAFGIPGRARLFEVEQKLKALNLERKAAHLPPIEFIAARPRMSVYMEYSRRVYEVYLKYIAPEDIHVYSVDEVFMDVTCYLNTYHMTAHELAMHMIQDVLRTTGITATAGIGTNLYLCKIAMDVEAKHVAADKDGVRIAELDEMSYREKLWTHEPLTDFWRVGRGIAKKLNERGMYTMGDVARCSLGGSRDFQNEDLLYKLFGVNAELLIDHAWGIEPCTMADIKKYKPMSHSLSQGQVLSFPHSFSQARLIVKEMADLLSMDVYSHGFVSKQLVLTVGYDADSADSEFATEIDIDRYGRSVPKSAHGTLNLDFYTSSSDIFIKSFARLFDRIADPKLLVRRMYVVANNVIPAGDVPEDSGEEQLNLFTDYHEKSEEKKKLQEQLKKDSFVQEAVMNIKSRYGKNAILKGMNFEEGATTRERNGQVGGHKA